MPVYVTLNELKAFVGITAGDTADDATLTRALSAAEAQIDTYTGRKFTADVSPVIRYYTAQDDETVLIDDVQTTTGLVVKTDNDGDGTFETTWALNTEFRLGPYNAAVDSGPWSYLVTVGSRRWPPATRAVEVTARYGFTAVPAPVQQAALIQAAFLWKRKDAPFGIAGSAEYGSELRILASLDPTARSLLLPYRIPWVVSA